MKEDTSAAVWAPMEQRKGQRGLSHNLSVYLDLLRLLAAMAVFMGHAGTCMPWLPSFITSQARNAVAVFFVLSGFVISFVVSEKEHSWRAYLTARVSRIYSVVVLALLVTWVCDTIGTYYNSNRYFELAYYNQDNLMAFLYNVTFLNELWFQQSIFGTNGTYWSLGFEILYYIFFGLIYFLPVRFKLPAALLWILVCGPKITVYLPLWLIGVIVYHCTIKVYLNVRQLEAAALMIFSIMAYLAMKKFFPWKLVSDMNEWQNYKNEIFSFIYFMLIGSSVFINIISFDRLVGDRKFWNYGFERWIRWLAGASFTLYLAHLPLLILISALLPHIGTQPFLGIV
ncbi:MAG: acyltransferase family protein, partial [Nitrosopumilaceae archaeon]